MKPASTPASIPDPGVWPRRLSSTEAATASELRRIDPHLAGLFERGLRLADDIDEPGIGYLVAHVGRELSRGVVSSLTGETLVRPESDVENAGGQTRFRKRIAEALDLPETDPHVISWFRSHQTLVSSTHWRDSAPSSEEIRESFVALVGLLFGRIAPYFDTQAELDELLHIDVPSPDDVERLKRSSIRYSQRQYFFSRLTNADWLRLLSADGFFGNPPDRRVHEDESWSLQRWPEGEALARLAAEAPDVVVAEFSSIPKDNSNPAVWDGVATAALAMRPTDASCLVPQLFAALKNAPPVLFPHSIIRVIQRLAEAGDRDAAFQLTEALLFVGGKSPRRRPAGGAVKSTRRWRLDQWEDLPESDVRQEDLRGLTWFVRTPYVPDEGVLTLGLRTLRASRGEAIGYGAIWEPLARLADVDASRTFRMAELLIEAALDRPHPHITFEQTQHVLACALAADDADTRDRSVQLIHTLGERGYVEFGQLLEGR